jgi:putative redox protein
MPTETVRLDWIQDQEFLLKDRAGFPILMTQPMGVNGADLLPLSVIGCAAWDLAAILKKQRQQVTALQVTAESEREDTPPWRFLRIRIVYRITGQNLKDGLIQKGIQLAEQKYCSTFATLKNAVEISSSYEILEDDCERECVENG